MRRHVASSVDHGTTMTFTCNSGYGAGHERAPKYETSLRFRRPTNFGNLKVADLKRSSQGSRCHFFERRRYKGREHRFDPVTAGRCWGMKLGFNLTHPTDNQTQSRHKCRELRFDTMSAGRC